jgi:transposase
VRASERDDQARALWWQEVVQLAATRLVFVDESGSHVAMTPAYARAPRGQRANAALPKNRGENTTIMGALSLAGWQVAMTIEGAADTAAFEVFIEHALRPTLRPGQIVIMDNLSIHKSQRVRQLIEEAGCTLLFLPTYSPDLNPIELAWSKLKAFLRRAAARRRDLLETAIGWGLNTITPQDAKHWFQHVGYHLI